MKGECIVKMQKNDKKSQESDKKCQLWQLKGGQGINVRIFINKIIKFSFSVRVDGGRVVGSVDVIQICFKPSVSFAAVAFAASRNYCPDTLVQGEYGGCADARTVC